MPNKNDFWDYIEASYPIYPTVKHRKRFIVKIAKKFVKTKPACFIFDYGCGTSDILKGIQDRLKLQPKQLGGSDISKRSIEISKNKIKGAYFFNEYYPGLPRTSDAIICSEVIEHVVEYKQILGWIYNNLKKDGILILSTQGGKMHKIDEYSGHVQTFKIAELAQLLKGLGFEILYTRKWGWPLFALQKYLTNYKFYSIKTNYLEGNPSKLIKLLFNFIYIVYFLHYFINKGPQLYIVAKK